MLSYSNDIVAESSVYKALYLSLSCCFYCGGIIYIIIDTTSVRYPDLLKKHQINIMSRETGALSSNTVDDISQGIGSVDISDGGIAAAAACDMTSGEDTISKSAHHVIKNGDAEVSICANCGKEGATNICNKCKQVKYCNAACKKKHKSKHKADCGELIRRGYP